MTKVLQTTSLAPTALRARYAPPRISTSLAVSMLRETRMPAVQIEPAFITNEREAAQIEDPVFAERVGRAVAAGVRRFFAD